MNIAKLISHINILYDTLILFAQNNFIIDDSQF